MQDPDFPEELCSFMQRCTPSVEAVELLLLVVRHPERSWTADELAAALRPTVIGEPAIREYMQTFAAHGLVNAAPRGYQATTPPEEIARVVHALAKVYNERPVSLVRMIYQLKEQKIQSFAEAFKIRKG